MKQKKQTMNVRRKRWNKQQNMESRKKRSITAIQKSWSKHRYGDYYLRMMEPVYQQRWDEELKRVAVLKEELESLGPIPQREQQLIKTLKYFVKIVDITTKFVDEGIINIAPGDKQNEVEEFNDAIQIVAGRGGKENDQYLNTAKVGENVNFNNLLLGRFSEIKEEDVKPTMKTRRINGDLYKVEIDYTPIIKWLNTKIVTADGMYANMSQKKTALVCKQLKEVLLEVINDLLK